MMTCLKGSQYFIETKSKGNFTLGLWENRKNFPDQLPSEKCRYMASYNRQAQMERSIHPDYWR